MPTYPPIEARGRCEDSLAIPLLIISWRQTLTHDLKLADLARLAGLSFLVLSNLDPDVLGTWAHATRNDICMWLLGDFDSSPHVCTASFLTH